MITSNPTPKRRGEIPSGRTICQAITDAVNRELRIQVAYLQQQLADVKASSSRRRRDPDPRKVFIAVYKAKGLSDFAIALTMDSASSKDQRLAPLAAWTKKTGSRLWSELFNAAKKFNAPKIQACTRKYFRLVQPFDSSKRTNKKLAQVTNRDPRAHQESA